MGKRFSNESELVVDATPEQVWDAIATGPGINSWFMGRSEVEPGSAVRTAFGDYTPDQPVTAWDPGTRLAYGEEPGPDGRFVAYEFLVEGRAGGSTVIRAVTSGFLPGDDWAAEYDAMTLGLAMFHRTLAEYLDHFAGRTARPITVFGPAVSDWAAAWRSLSVALQRQGDAVSTPFGAGTVYFENRHTLGIRTPRALYRFLRGLGGQMISSPSHLRRPRHRHRSGVGHLVERSTLMTIALTSVHNGPTTTPKARAALACLAAAGPLYVAAGLRWTVSPSGRRTGRPRWSAGTA